MEENKTDVTFIVHKEWLENIKGLPVPQQDKIIADFIRYGVEAELQHEDDPVVVAIVNMIKGRIDFSKNKYEEKVDMSKKAGRKKKINDEKVRMLIKQGKTAGEIAQILGCSKSTIDHNEIWRNRKKSDNDNKLKAEMDGKFVDCDEGFLL